MSHFLKMKVDLTDPEAIVRGLVRMGVNRNAIEVHEKPVTLIGYNGETRQANIIVRKQWLEQNRTAVNMNGYCYADMGFHEQADGTYQALVDDHNFNPTWVNKMATYHNVEKAKIALDGKKIKYVESIEEGKPVLTATLPFKTRSALGRQTLGFSG